MSAIEITSELALTTPAPVRIELPAAAIPRAAALALKDAGGGPDVPAQADGPGALVALIGPVSERARKRYTLQAAARATPGITLRAPTDGTLEFAARGEPVTTYHFGTAVPRPFFFPVLGPGGRPVTRSFPMKTDVPGETHDHPHHRSLWTAYGEVNDTDNWSESAGKHGFIRHQSFKEQVSGPVFGGFTAENLWTGPDGGAVMRETRRVRFYNATGHRLFDYEVTFSASEGDVHFGDTKEGGILAFRVATSMDGNKGGRIENASGGITEKQCWGKPAAWCDYSGPTGGAILGIAVMDHPSNFRHPCHWHVRDYGLTGTNVFGTSSFEGTPGDRGAYVLPKGKALTFRYRVLLHEGNAAQGKVSDVYHGYIQPPVGRAGG